DLSRSASTSDGKLLLMAVRNGFILFIVTVLLAVVSLHAYPKGAPPGVTGGFGEGTCNECHDSYALNAGRTAGLGDLVVTGFPNRFEVNWVAPPTAVGELVVNAAGNAANGDASPVGDYIYATSLSVASPSH